MADNKARSKGRSGGRHMGEDSGPEFGPVTRHDVPGIGDPYPHDSEDGEGAEGGSGPMDYKPVPPLTGKVKARIMKILCDGNEHTREELSACLGDELSPKRSVGVHISLMRQTLRQQGLTIACRKHGGRYLYRLRRFVASSNE